MELRPIPARGWADWYTQELCASFPACECKPLEAIRALAAEGRYELLGLYGRRGGGRYSSRPRRSAPAARRRSGPCGCAAWGSMPETAAPPFMRASTAACSARSLCWGPPRRIGRISRRPTGPSTARPGRTWS